MAITPSSTLNSDPSTSSSSPSGNDSSPSELNFAEAFEKVALTQAQLSAQLRTQASDFDQRVGKLSQRVTQLEPKLNQLFSQLDEASGGFETFSTALQKKLGISNSEEMSQYQIELKIIFNEEKGELTAQINELRENIKALQMESETNQKEIEKILSAKEIHDQSPRPSASPDFG